MENETEDRKWIRIMTEQSHTPILDRDGELDIFVCDHGFHNGSGCSTCKDS